MNMQVEFSQYVVSLARGVLTGIGDIPDPDTQDFKDNVLLAQHSLAVLKMLQAKTVGNLNEEEKNLIEVLVKELEEKLQAFLSVQKK